MVPEGIEMRPELSGQSDALAFGFSGGQVSDLVAIKSLLGLIEHLEKSVEPPQSRLVIVDMRNVSYLDSTSLATLVRLQKRLKERQWQLLLVIDDPTMRELWAVTRLDTLIKIAGSADLAEFVGGQPGSATQTASPSSGRVINFTREELAEMKAAGITLDDAIRAIEPLRG